MPKTHGVSVEAALAATDTLTPALLDAWTATQQLWLASRQGSVPHQIAGQLAAAHAAMDRAVYEAERAGAAVIERDRDGRITAIRAPGWSAP